MPQIKVRKYFFISTDLINELKIIIDCPRNYFTIEHIDTTFITYGNITSVYPFI